ncbi:MAG: ribosome maturation factor RimP [Epsilonproteobacteria bacterium]|nr:ribosome maturation factor RimP [Campylobacterota bacterium]
MIDEEMLAQIIEDNGAFLYDTELTEENDQKIFRVYITTPNGITLDECAKITNIISPIIDTNPPTQDKYFLEVSSPGVERALKKPKHFKNSIGETLKLKTIHSKKYISKLVEANDKGIKIEDKNKTVFIPYDEISKARTYIEW